MDFVSSWYMRDFRVLPSQTYIKIMFEKFRNITAMPGCIFNSSYVMKRILKYLVYCTYTYTFYISTYTFEKNINLHIDTQYFIYV